MKTILLFLMACFIFTGCSRSQSYIGTSTSNAFYFTTENGDLFEYSGMATKIEGEKINSLSKANAEMIHSSTKHSLNILSSSGRIVFRHEPSLLIQASVISSDLNEIIYADASGQLHRHNRTTNESENLGVSLYPLPKQMILDETFNVIIYHDQSNIYELDLNAYTKKRLTKMMFPIQSIAYRKNTRDIYFSTSTDGKIYKLNYDWQFIEKIHDSMSARGGSVAINTADDTLYFSKTNGRDIQINALNLETNQMNTVVWLNKINHITNLMIKD